MLPEHSFMLLVGIDEMQKLMQLSRL
jgi:hypothetical protein